MSIGFGKQSAASVPVPPVGEQNFFVDSSDDKFKKKLSDASIVDLEGIASGVTSFNGRTGVVIPQLNDYLPLFPEATVSDDGLMSSNDKQKLDGIATGATANQTDLFLLNRANHTGTQPANTITGLAQVATSGDKADVGLGSVDNTPDISKPVSSLQAAADAAVQAFSIQRANHTGLQLASTIADFDSAAKASVVLNTLSGNQTDQAPSVNATKAGDSATLVLANAYTDTAIANVIDGAPAALDTLNELAAALADDANFASTMTTALANRLRIDTATQGLTGTQKTNAKTNIDLQNVDNTSDINKPISTATQTALNNKITQLSGEATTPTPGSGVVTLQNAAVIGKTLTGFQVDWNIVTAADTILQAIQKLAGRSAMSINTVSGNTEVPAGYTWIRQNRSRFSGTTKISIKAGGKIRFIN